MRDTGVHMTHKNFRRVLFGRALFGGLLFLSVLLFAVPGLRAQSAEVRATGVYYIDGGTTINGQYCNWDPDDLDSRSSYNKSAIVNVGDMQTNDPWQTSALIEYDQPYPAPSTATANNYPNHCLALCMDVYCTNKPNGATTYSISFPIQNIMFEIVKYRNGADISNPETNPAIRTIYQSILDNQSGDQPRHTHDLPEHFGQFHCIWGRCQWQQHYRFVGRGDIHVVGGFI